MSETVTLQADYDALNNLVVNCPEFAALEAKLGDFNLFQVLRSEFSELKHSNVLAWLLDPAESHGLDDIFLQKWLMRVIHLAPSIGITPITPVDIDAWELRNVEIRREWENIDLLLILEMVDGQKWVVCIENKVHSSQHSDQLARYRGIVEREFRAATHRLYLFLTKHNEVPEDEAYLPTTYSGVHQALIEAVTLRRLSIGAEPRVLIDNYIRLLEEKFMNESDIARMALTIYKKHRHAIEVIFAHRPENIRGQVLPRLGELLDERAGELGIVSGPNEKNYVRFIPAQWDQPGNHHGTHWPTDVGVVFEIDFFTDRPRFMLVAALPPDEWAGHVQRLCDAPPFKHLKGQQRRGKWPRFYSEEIDAISDPAMLTDIDETAEAIFAWIKDRLASPELQTVIETIAAEIPRLDEIHRSLPH